MEEDFITKQLTSVEYKRKLAADESAGVSIRCHCSEILVCKHEKKGNGMYVLPVKKILRV